MDDQAPGYRTSDCCTGINGSHTAACAQSARAMLTCWCCRKLFPSTWTCLWSEFGSRCFRCERHPVPCPRLDQHRASINAELERLRGQTYEEVCAEADEIMQSVVRAFVHERMRMAMSDPNPLEARTLAMSRIEGLLTLPERELALLFHVLTLHDWTRDRAKAVLVKERWWL